MRHFKIKGQLAVCFSLDEVNNLLSIRALEGFMEYCQENDISFTDLLKDEKRATELAKSLGKEAAKGDTHEIFAAFITALDFYEEGSEICFQLKNNFIPSRSRISSLQDLIAYKSDPPDFIIKSQKGYRLFELKRYIEADDSSLNVFLQKKLSHYGNALNDLNLLIMLQGEVFKESKVDFQESHNYLNSLSLRLDNSSVLVSYNEMNSSSVIVEIYPQLRRWKVPFQLPGDQINASYSAL